jgi:hypothetical protein
MYDRAVNSISLPGLLRCEFPKKSNKERWGTHADEGGTLVAKEKIRTKG